MERGAPGVDPGAGLRLSLSADFGSTSAREPGSCVFATCALEGPRSLHMLCKSWGSPPAVMPDSPSCYSPPTLETP